MPRTRRKSRRYDPHISPSERFDQLELPEQIIYWNYFPSVLSEDVESFDPVFTVQRVAKELCLAELVFITICRHKLKIVCDYLALFRIRRCVAYIKRLIPSFGFELCDDSNGLEANPVLLHHGMCWIRMSKWQVESIEQFNLAFTVTGRARILFFSTLWSLELLASSFFNALCPLYPASHSTPSSSAGRCAKPCLKTVQSFLEQTKGTFIQTKPPVLMQTPTSSVE
jgi:hypothetical protein